MEEAAAALSCVFRRATTPFYTSRRDEQFIPSPFFIHLYRLSLEIDLFIYFSLNTVLQRDEERREQCPYVTDCSEASQLASLHVLK